MRARRLACALAALAAGCGGTTPTPLPFGGGSSGDARFEAGPFDVAPGEVRTACTYVASADAAETVVGLRAELDEGVAAIAVYRVDHAIDAEPSDCPEGGQPGWELVAELAGAADEIALPTDVGVPFGAAQALVLATRLEGGSAGAAGASARLWLSYAGLAGASRRAGALRVEATDLVTSPGPLPETHLRCALPDDAIADRLLGREGPHGAWLRAGVVARGDSVARPLYEAADGDAPAPIAPRPAGVPLAHGDAIDLACALHADSAWRLGYPTELCRMTGIVHDAPAPLVCQTAGRTGACACAWRAALDAGPGGGRVALEVARAATIPGALSDLGAGAPIRCELHRGAEMDGEAPRAGTRSAYLAEVRGALAEASAKVGATIVDVTPGEYAALCFMDTPGGGAVAAKGAAIAAHPPRVTVTAGATATARVVLDAAVP